MKTGIHPQYFDDAKVTCVCGSSFTTGSTKPEIRVDICNKCHPFFTGQQKFVDTVGRIERFQKKQSAAAAKPYKKKEKEAQQPQRPRTLREMLLADQPKAGK